MRKIFSELKVVILWLPASIEQKLYSVELIKDWLMRKKRSRNCILGIKVWFCFNN